MNTALSPRAWRMTWLAVAAASTLALTACDRNKDGATVGQKVDSAVQKTEQVAKEGVDQAKESMASAESALKNEQQQAGTSVKEAGEKVAGMLDDASITASVSASLAKDPELSAIRIDVDTKNGNVTLKGPAPTASARDRASDIARNIKGVNSVNNELVVKQG
jgi:hypothetical protein